MEFAILWVQFPREGGPAVKTKYWIILLCAVVAICTAAALFLLLPGEPATHAQILQDGRVIRTVALDQDQEFTVTNGSGYNVITVRDGAIAVTEASCPDHYCMHRGFCSSGMQIVCLPNALVIRFTGAQEVDGFTG